MRVRSFTRLFTVRLNPKLIKTKIKNHLVLSLDPMSFCPLFKVKTLP